MELMPTPEFDIIGDVHGCFDELALLLEKLGYKLEEGLIAHAPRELIFVGDLSDRGPGIAEAIRLVMDASERGLAICLQGNHDDRLRRGLMGNAVGTGYGYAESIKQLEITDGEQVLTPETLRGKRDPEEFARLYSLSVARPCKEIADFFTNLPYLIEPAPGLCVVHAAFPPACQEDVSKKKAFQHACMYGDTDGSADEHGVPVRRDWAQHYDGPLFVAYGHTPCREAVFRNNTIDLDTGCVFGGKLTALRWPERELVSVKAARVYALPRAFADFAAD